MHVLDTITYADVGVKTGTIKGIPTDRSVRVWTLSGVYNVTDVGIVAGEDFDGYQAYIICKGSRKSDGKIQELWHFETNEIVKAMKTAPPAGNVPQYQDTLPTTAQDQRIWFSWLQPHDLSLYKSVWVEFKSQTAATEWAAASAFTLELGLDLTPGPVERSFAMERYYQSTDTVHNFQVGDNTITDITIYPGTADYIDEVELPGSWTLPRGYVLAGKVMYDTLRGAVSTTDSVDALRSGPIMDEPYTNRQIHIHASTTTTILVFAMTIVGKTEISNKARAEDLIQGRVDAVSRVDNATGKTVSGTPTAPASTRPGQLTVRQVGGSKLLDQLKGPWFK
jgi:hypothetical protein